MNWTFCDMPFESAWTFLSAAAAQAETRQPPVGFAGDVGTPAALQLAVVGEQPPNRHLLVEAALLGQVADAVAGGDRTAVAEDLDGRRCRAAGCS